jgi:predicted GIY-YIG superfamily endonuclease
MYLVYLIKSNNLSYVGMTNDFTKRLRQHNQEIKGGAKYTKKSINWYPILIIDGFKDMKSACQCEWRLKRGKGGCKGRINYLNNYIKNNKQWTSKSDLIENQNLIYYIDNDYKDYLNQLTRELYWKD